jgi:integrase
MSEVMYNMEQKERYLDNCKYEDTTIETIKIIFRASADVEKFYNTDVSLFNRLQVYDFLKKLNAKSRNYLRSACIYLSDYYNWCYSEHLVPTNIIGNQFDVNMTRGLIEEIIPREMLANKYFTQEELIEYINNQKDVSNKFILYALYLGVKGEEYQELINLKMEDLDEQNKVLRLITGRTIQVDDLFIDLMKQTNDSNFYYADGVKKILRNGANEYLPSRYVLKQCKTGTSDSPITKGILQPRLGVIKEASGNQYLTVSVIYKNGLINYIKKQYAKENITLKQAMTSMINGAEYEFEKQTQDYTYEFGSKITTRMLRLEIKDYIDLL